MTLMATKGILWQNQGVQNTAAKELSQRGTRLEKNGKGKKNQGEN